ncbi:MAG: VIT1/CCC1 transporter family protein [Candidatus Rokubacteria bacterium]|nr:VIT1/CCC1 transporter family protein [Candidatus Rokubacteria bacterium]
MTRGITSKTDANLQVALAGEADANRRYIAYGVQALNEGRPEIAQLFFEAAGAETVHALNHLRTMRAIGTTRENLERAATGEMEEIEVILPRMIQEAQEEARQDAAASFRLALDRERHHRDMFRAALAAFDRVPPARPPEASPPPPPATAVAAEGRSVEAPPAPPERDRAHGAAALGARASAMLGSDGKAQGHGAELATEPERIERLGSIRELVFGAQDGLVSTFAVVAGLAAAGAHHLVVLLAGLVSAAAGVLSMSIGTFLSSRAQRQVYEAELARERREIRDHPGEEVAELVASLMSRGMSRADAVEVGRRVARHPDLLLATLGMFELGLAPQRLGTPVRDAFVMAGAFGGAALLPLLPFLMPRVSLALGLAGLLTVLALFAVGVVKGRLAHVSPVRSGLEVVALGLGSGIVGYGLGRLASVVLGIEIQ